MKDAYYERVGMSGPSFTQYYSGRRGYDRPTRAPNVEGQSMVKHIKTGEEVEVAIKKLEGEDAELYKEYRKIGTAAFNKAEEEAKTKWQAENPGKEYAGKPRRSFVEAGIAAAQAAIEAKEAEKTTNVPGMGEQGNEAFKILNRNRNSSGLALQKIGYDKDKFLRIKGHYGSNYEHINVPNIGIS